MDIKTILCDLLYAVITIAVPIIVKYGVSFLQSKIDGVQANIKNGTINSTIDFVQNIVEQIVIEINQTYVDKLKEEGKFDEAAAQMAYEAAVTKAKELINENYQKVLEELFGNIDDYLKVLIENYVNANKLIPTNE